MRASVLAALLISFSSGSFAQVNVDLPDTSGAPGDTLVIPIQVGDLYGKGVLAFEFTVAFDQSVVFPVLISEVGTVSDQEGWTFLPNELPGQLRVGAFGPSGLQGAGCLFRLGFKLIGAAGKSTSLTLNPFLFNSGTPAVWVRNGSLTISGVSGVKAAELGPPSVVLKQNYPNPFNPSTTIAFTLAHRSDVTLTVYDQLGQQIARLVEGEVDAGYHEVRFDGGSHASGVYFYRIQTGGSVETRKLTLLH